MSQEPLATPPHPPFQTVRQMILELIVTPDFVPLPDNEEWAGMISRINQFHVVHEVAEETYDYFLEVLPPKWMGCGGFAFAEGAEPLHIFVRYQGRYRCLRLDQDQTTLFCRLAGIATPW